MSFEGNINKTISTVQYCWPGSGFAFRIQKSTACICVCVCVCAGVPVWPCTADLLRGDESRCQWGWGPQPGHPCTRGGRASLSFCLQGLYATYFHGGTVCSLLSSCLSRLLLMHIATQASGCPGRKQGEGFYCSEKLNFASPQDGGAALGSLWAHGRKTSTSSAPVHLVPLQPVSGRTQKWKRKMNTQMQCDKRQTPLPASPSDAGAWPQRMEEKGRVSGPGPSLPAGTDSKDASPAISLGQLVLLTFMHRRLLKMHLQTLGMGTEVRKAALSQAAHAARPRARTRQHTPHQKQTQSTQPWLTWEKHSPEQRTQARFPSNPTAINAQEYNKQKLIPSTLPSSLLSVITCPLFPTATVF